MNYIHLMVVNANKALRDVLRINPNSKFILFRPNRLKAFRKNAESFLIINGGLNIIKTSLVTQGIP